MLRASSIPTLGKDLILPEASCRKSLRDTCDTIKLVERIRQLANHELQASTEFMKWLKFGELERRDVADAQRRAEVRGMLARIVHILRITI
jgi:hypothetical protein